MKKKFIGSLCLIALLASLSSLVVNLIPADVLLPPGRSMNTITEIVNV